MARRTFVVCDECSTELRLDGELPEGCTTHDCVAVRINRETLDLCDPCAVKIMNAMPRAVALRLGTAFLKRFADSSESLARLMQRPDMPVRGSSQVEA